MHYHSKGKKKLVIIIAKAVSNERSRSRSRDSLNKSNDGKVQVNNISPTPKLVLAEGRHKEKLSRNNKLLKSRSHSHNPKKMKLQDLEMKLISGLFTFEELKKNGTKMMEITYRTSIFYGEIKVLDDSRCHKEGKGILMYETGRVYEGNWKNNKREGLGFEKFENGNIYQGEFMLGRAHGRGVYVWENAETYDGEWYKGMRQGKGIWKGI